jgi:hypothetical protein
MVLALNEKIIRDKKDDDDNINGSGIDTSENIEVKNKGTLIVDATCTPADIRFPTDVSLLNEAREKLEKIIDVLHEPSRGKKPRTYRKRARKCFVSFVAKRKHSKKDIRKALKKQLQFVARDIRHVESLITKGAHLEKLLRKEYKNFLVIHESCVL